jgi:hypothetical protein
MGRKGRGGRRRRERKRTMTRTKPEVSGRKEIIKIRATDEIETKKYSKY